MRLLLLTAALLAAPMAAQAADPNLSDEFQTICVANRMDMSKAVAAARAKGYTDLQVDTPTGVGAITALKKDVGSNRWAVVVGTGSSPAAGTSPGQAFIACNVTGFDVGTTGGDALRRWVGVAAAEATATRMTYFYTEKNGRRVAVDSKSDAAMVQALNGGGYFLMQIDVVDKVTAVTLTRATPGP